MSQAEAVSSPCRPLTNRPPVPDGTTLHYAVASTEAKLVFSDSTREATHAFGGLDILESADWRFSRNDAHTSTELFPLSSGFAQGKSVGNKYEIRTSAKKNPSHGFSELCFSVQPHPQLLVARKGLFRRGDQTQSGDARLVPRHERAPRTATSHPASAYRLSGGPRREAARPRRDTHGDEVPVAFHLRHSCVRRPRKLW